MFDKKSEKQYPFQSSVSDFSALSLSRFCILLNRSNTYYELNYASNTEAYLDARRHVRESFFAKEINDF